MTYDNYAFQVEPGYDSDVKLIVAGGSTQEMDSPLPQTRLDLSVADARALALQLLQNVDKIEKRVAYREAIVARRQAEAMINELQQVCEGKGDKLLTDFSSGDLESVQRYLGGLPLIADMVTDELEARSM